MNYYDIDKKIRRHERYVVWATVNNKPEGIDPYYMTILGVPQWVDLMNYSAAKRDVLRIRRNFSIEVGVAFVDHLGNLIVLDI